MSSEIALRRASFADAKLLFEWRNDAATRRASRNSAAVSWPEHQAWLIRVLASPDHDLRIAEHGGRPVGVVRADRNANGWELSWTVAPEVRELGIGTRMLSIFAEALKGPIVAFIRPGNMASAKMAMAAGFTKSDAAESDGFERWVKTG